LTEEKQSLAIQKRVTHITIEKMEAPWGEYNGKTVKMCLNGCGKPVPEGNRKYCSQECSFEFYAKHSQQGLREFVYAREHGMCQKCQDSVFGKD